MAIEKLREGGKKRGKIIGYKVRLPALDGKRQWTTTNYMVSDWDDAKGKAQEAQQNEKKRRKRKERGEWPGDEELQGWTTRALILKYRESNDDEFKLQDNWIGVLWQFANLPICDYTLFDFNKQIAEKYANDQIKATYIGNGSEVAKTYARNTIQRRITALQNAWKWGRKTFPELSKLENPWEGIVVPGTGFRKQRGLRSGELDKLEAACKGLRGSNRYYVSLAIHFATDTAMRRQEIFDLTWKDIEFENRRIHIKHDKNSWRRLEKGLPEDRRVVLPPLSQILLMQLYISLKESGCTPGPEPFEIPKEFHPPHGKIFMGFEKRPMTGNGFKQLFEQATEWAGIKDPDPRKRLTPHSLRAAAEMGYRRAGMLNKDDKLIDVQKNGIKSHYDVEEELLDMFQDKLDRAYFNRPLQEVVQEQAEHQSEFQSLYEDGLRDGLDGEAAQERATAAMLEKYPKYAEIKATLASLPSTQARLAEEEA